MLKFEDIIFNEYFSKKDKREDINKDSEGKGTLERYNELMGVDLDTMVLPYVDNLLANRLVPETAVENAIPYLESERGFDPKNDTLYLGSSILMRRAVLRAIRRLYQVKGTIRGYEIPFGMLGMTLVLTEFLNENGFDSDITLDFPTRRFDSFCPSCADYSIALTGVVTLTPDLIRAIRSIIIFNQPIDTKVRSITYNGAVIDELYADFNLDFSDDFLI